MAHPRQTPLPPGSTIGVFGSGQLGRMLAIEARRLGYRIHTFSPERNSPTGQIADFEYAAAYDDTAAVRSFIRGVDALTFEFENVPTLVAETAKAEGVPVRPSVSILHAAQNRQREKSMLSQAGLPVTPHRFVTDTTELKEAVHEIGFPAILKTAAFGYDGKGQTRIERDTRLESAWNSLGRQPCLLEAFVNFEKELSIVAVRGQNGDFAPYPLVENRHVNHILDVTIAPADVEPSVAQEAERLACQLCDFLDLTGVLCIEFFCLPDTSAASDPTALESQSTGRLLINEIAPRPHNSGHWTIEGAVTSQFEQQLRTVSGLAPGSTQQLRPAVMLNLLGDLWQKGEPNWPALLAFSNVKLHLYGKHEPRPGRKMGHLTVTAATTAEALEMGLQARAALQCD
ncbi:MAG: 5-(carboxyamino)imidazole ribonucleotide synthase [Caldilineaceae bacterium SB0668_bin_21]|nr:5-(carboxyamino)imidazole ribonucleotide synthase [Caldilineaceae bacterium SB0668_bin_21]MYC22938.1 5-(carboxyamino)imidazole ribonucleotide synthase [Caldilineaceae bacterium SB0662_bin_25]